MNTAVPIALLPLLVGLGTVALVVAGVVMLIVTRGRRGWWLLGPGLGLLLVGGAFMLFWGVSMPVPEPPLDRGVVGRSADRPPVPVPVAAPSPRDVATNTPAAPAFLADVYPSAAGAAEALAARLSESVASIAAEGGAEAPPLWLTGPAPQDVLRRAAEAFRRRALVGSVEVSTPGSTAPTGAGGVRCGVYVSGSGQGTVRMVLAGPRGHLSESVRFVEKPWAADFARYVTTTGRDCLLARSGPACTSTTEADLSAYRSAAAQLAPAVSRALHAPPHDQRLPAAARPGTSELNEWIADELRRGKNVQDHFTQCFHRPYGDLWQRTLLVRAAPADIDALAAAVAQRAASRHTARVWTWSRTAGSLLALAALILLAYMVLNAATKGYYAWVLRLAAATLVLGGAAVLLMLA